MPEAEADGAPLRLLFLTQTYPRRPHDGAGPFIRDLARGLVRGGDRVRVLAPHAAGLRGAWEEDGVEVRTFRYAPARFELFGYGRSLRADERSALPALAVAPLYLAGARRALAAELAREPWDLVQAHWLVPNLLAAAPLSRRVPLVVGLHGSDVFMAEKPLVAGWSGRALARTRALTSCSPELARRVEALGFPPSRSTVIPYGVDSELFRPDPVRRPVWRERLAIPALAPLILGVGRMATKKGFHDLLGAFAEIAQEQPEAHLVLAGGGDRLAEFRDRATGLGGRVHFPGAVLHDELPDLYRAADLFALPAVHDSKGNVDGLPNVILEAMASALPVIGTSISGLPLAIAPGENGWLVGEGDSASLAAALREALGDRARLRALGERGRERAVREFGWDEIARRYRAVYREAIRTPR
ncbi:MAG: glycosyltransferase [Thermoanaerobaculia bacterium]